MLAYSGESIAQYETRNAVTFMGAVINELRGVGGVTDDRDYTQYKGDVPAFSGQGLELVYAALI